LTSSSVEALGPPPNRRFGTIRLTASLGAGAFFALAAPESNLYPTLWLGMAALAALLEEPRQPAVGSTRVRRLLQGSGRGLAFGIGANVVALRFVPDVIQRFTPLPWALGCLALLLLACEQGVRWAVAAVVRTHLARRGVPGWLAFGAGVFVGTFVPAVFPWTPAGGVTPIPQMVQLAELAGERGVTLLMALSSGLLASSVRDWASSRRETAGDRKRAAARRSLFAAWAAVGVPMLTFAFGQLRIAHVEEERSRALTTKIALIDPATPALERWDPAMAVGILQRLTSLTRKAEKDGADLTIWPEAAYPVQVAHGSRYCPIGARAILPMGVRGPVLTGLIMTGDDGDLWNSAAVCRTDGTLSRPYDKIRLLWFGETIPLLDRIPWIRRTFARGTGLVGGENNVVQVAGSVRASVLNCFEDTLPAAGREAMSDRPNLLVNVTNDAWFAGSGESELHLRLAALRAVESRRDLVRAVNFGPTSWVDAAGVVRGRYDAPLPGILLASPALLEAGPTLYDRLGDAPTSLLLLLVVFRRARRMRV
jgi:apolipoprotein N-acyltransferase